MIKELSTEEIGVCYGAVKEEERVTGADAAVFGGGIAGCLTLWACYMTGLMKMRGGSIATVFFVSAVWIVTYYNNYGKKYTVSIDDDDPEMALCKKALKYLKERPND